MNPSPPSSPPPLPRLAGAVEPPDPALPLAFFAAALTWLVAGSAALMLLAPPLAAGQTQQPAIFAVTHCFTLGVLASAIFGALHQFVPAIMGVPIRYPRVAWWGLWLSQLGTLLLVLALWRWQPLWQAGAWLLLFAGVGCASVNTLPARRRAVRNRRVGLYISLGHSGLGLAMLLAAARIGDGLGWWHTARDPLLTAHFHLGVFGFGTLTAMGMTSRMLPTFLDAHATDDRALDWVGWAAAAGLLVHAGGTIAAWPPLTLLGAVLLAVALLRYATLVLTWFLRRRRSFDPALAFIAAAFLGYTLAGAAGTHLLLRAPQPPHVQVVYAVLAVLGWLVTLILGVLHRVGPRIAAAARGRHGLPLPPAARAGELPWPLVAWSALAAWVPGWLLLAAATATGHAQLATGGTLLMTLGALLVALQAAALLRHRTR